MGYGNEVAMEAKIDAMVEEARRYDEDQRERFRKVRVAAGFVSDDFTRKALFDIIDLIEGA